jgi:TRAP-type C4-dicarboxylate transport system permease small subunit
MEHPAAAPPATPLDRLAALVNGLGALALVGVVGVQVWQVFARYVLNASPSWTEPVATLLLTTAMSLGAAVMVHRQAHFGFVLARDAAPPPIRTALTGLVDLAIAAAGAAIALWGVQLLVDGWDVPLAGVDLPQSAPYLPFAAGGALIAVFALGALLARLRHRQVAP